jgi:hypothetical protein
LSARKKTSAKVKRGGRPRKDLSKKDLDRVAHLASLGVCQRDIVPVLSAGVAERTLRDKIATMPEVSAAYARGRAQRLEKGMRRAWNMAMGEGPCRGMPRNEQAKMLRWVLERQFGMTAAAAPRSGPDVSPIRITEVRYHYAAEDDE